MAILRRQYVSEGADNVQPSAKERAWQDGVDRKEGHHQNGILNSKSTSSPVTQHPDAISFFKDVRPDGYPEQENAPPKAQPWRAVWEGPKVSGDGKLLIACPKRCDWGSGSGLGGY